MYKQNSHLVTGMLSLVLVAGMLTGCVARPAAAPAMSAPAPQPVAGQLTVQDAMARPAPLVGGNGAIYLTLLNGLDGDVQLQSASSPAANVVELHETMDDNGVMRMIYRPEGFAIPAGGSLELKPGGKHVMLIDLVQPLAVGDTVEVSLSFDNGETTTLSVPVVDMVAAMGAAMPMDMTDSAADHDHGAMDATMPMTMTDSAGAHDHGAMDMTAGGDVAALIEQLPISQIHALDEALGAGTVDAEAAVTVAALLQALDNPGWPAAMHEQLAAIRDLAEQLQADLASGDLTAAAKAAGELHGLLHALEHAGH